MKYLNNLRYTALLSSLALGIFLATPLKLEAKVTEAQKSSTERVVYGATSSPFVFKVLVAMAEKNLDFKLIETWPVKILKAKGIEPLPEFNKASPLGKIPAYQEGPWSIADSSVIIAYLDRKNPDRPLYPSEPKKFAETLWFEKYGDEVLASVVHHKILFEKIIKPKFFGGKTDEAVLQQSIDKELPEIFSYLEKELIGKEWIIGNQFTAADIAIGTHLVSLKKCGVDISSEKWPNLARYAQSLFVRSSFKMNMKGI